MRIAKISLFLACLFSFNLKAQTDSIIKHLSFSGYLEAYYLYDFNEPQNHTRPSFIYSHNRHNEFNINIGFVKMAYNKDNIRSGLAMMTGTYSNSNLSAEPGVLKNIYEAVVGYKISKKKNIWLDAGVFSSHIGFESAIGKDCWALTRSLMADNSPYFESGAKVTYTSNNEKWTLTGLLLNGWQRIQRVDFNSTPAFGHQIIYKPNDKLTLNSSSFVGNDFPDSTRKMRYFHNIYAIYNLSAKFGITAAFDIGVQQTKKYSKSYYCWYTPVVIFKYTPKSHYSFSLRGEYFKDQNGVIISTGTANGFDTFGASLNFDYHINEHATIRFEGRGFKSKDEIFVRHLGITPNDIFAATALMITF